MLWPSGSQQMFSFPYQLLLLKIILKKGFKLKRNVFTFFCDKPSAIVGFKDEIIPMEENRLHLFEI